MPDSPLTFLGGPQVIATLRGRERDVVAAVAAAYRAHAEGLSALPHSVFLRFPDHERNRIIALPAYLGAGFGLAGLKWIASFPDNLERGLDRASATMILNSTETGQPTAVLEGSVISACRTAASAALAAATLLPRGSVPGRIGLVGCGLIQFEILRYLKATLAGLGELVAFDLSSERAAVFAAKAEAALGLRVVPVSSLERALGDADLVSFATTAIQPYVADLGATAAEAVVLHISLRDLQPAAVLGQDNTVDDVDHVCRAQTSLHLAEQKEGHRRFIRCSLGEILLGRASARRPEGGRAVFSPFGLGILDLALAHLAVKQAEEQGTGTKLEDFLPPSWLDPGWG